MKSTILVSILLLTSVASALCPDRDSRSYIHSYVNSLFAELECGTPEVHYSKDENGAVKKTKSITCTNAYKYCQSEDAEIVVNQHPTYSEAYHFLNPSDTSIKPQPVEVVRHDGKSYIFYKKPRQSLRGNPCSEPNIHWLKSMTCK